MSRRRFSFFASPLTVLGFARNTENYIKYQRKLTSFINNIFKMPVELSEAELEAFADSLDTWILDLPDFFTKLAEDDNYRFLLLDALYKHALDEDNHRAGIPVPLHKRGPLRYLVECYRPDASEREVRHRFPDPMMLIPGYGFFAMSKYRARTRTDLVKEVISLLPACSLDFENYCNATFRSFGTNKEAAKTMLATSKMMVSGFTFMDIGWCEPPNEQPEEFALLLREVLEVFLQAKKKHLGDGVACDTIFRNTPVSFQGKHFANLKEALAQEAATDVHCFSFRALDWVFSSLSKEEGATELPFPPYKVEISLTQEEEDLSESLLPFKRRCIQEQRLYHDVSMIFTEAV